MSESIWETLNKIDCNKHIEKKGKFSYLAWTWAWAMVKEKYPRATYELLEDTVFPDNTMEVRVRVVIEELSHDMWLPVLNFQNNAICSPDAFAINSSRMRCLVKCLAMFGLGHYIYAGESIPQSDPYTPEQLSTFNMLLANEDGFGFVKFFHEVGEDARDALFNSAPKGEKTKLKDKCRELMKVAHASMKKSILGIQEGLESNDLSAIDEVLDECTEIEKGLIWARLTEIEQLQVSNLRSPK